MEADELLKCANCGGFGKGLVHSKDGLCTHCLREKKLFFDPETSPHVQKGYVDISPNADGKILKRTKKLGIPGEFLEEGCPTDIQYIARLDDGTIVDTTRDFVDGKHIGGTDDPFNFIIGRGKAIKGFDIGVMTMAKNEIAEFIFHSDYGYGATGLPPKIEPHATLFYEIELISFKNALPPFPSQIELAESKKQQELEAQRMLKENPPPTVSERIAGSIVEKEKGNELLKQSKYDEAQKEYDSGFVHLYFSKEEWEYVLNEEEKKLVNQAKLPLHLNRALCKIKLQKFHDALWDCDCALEIDASNTKAHFRRGRVYLEKVKEELEKEKKKEFWIIDKAMQYAKECEKSLEKAKEHSENKSDGQLVSTINEFNHAYKLLRKYEKNYYNEQKKLYKDRIFKRLSEKTNNNQADNNNDHKLEEDIYADMPPLE